MNSVIFDDEALKKKVYSFNENERKEFECIEIGSIVEVKVEDVQKKAMILRFRVTRNAHLGMRQRWVYGKLLNDPASEYYQEVQIRLHEDEPESDSIAVFLKAPPLSSASF